MASYRYFRLTCKSGWDSWGTCLTSIHICDADGDKYNTESMTHTADHTLNGSASNCSDTETASWNYWQFVNTDCPNAWTVDLGSGNAQECAKLKITPLATLGRNVKAFELHGSNNGSDWTLLLDDETSSAADGDYIFDITYGVTETKSGSGGAVAGGSATTANVFSVSGSGGAVCGAIAIAPTSYDNEGGKGDRTSQITITQSGFLYGTLSALVNGAYINGPFPDTVSNGWLKFDFGESASKVIDELKFFQADDKVNGTWKVQGSDDDSAWTDLSDGFTLGGAATVTKAFSNLVGYRYYRIFQTGGTTDFWSYWNEFEFKITDEGSVVPGVEYSFIPSPNHEDGVSSGGIVFGGGEVSDDEVHQVDGACVGGIVFGGTSSELWQAIPNTTVAVKGGTYRISGDLCTLAETSSYPGLGTIAAIVDCGAAPATAGLYRYDLLSINATGTITVTAGTEAATPVMPATPSSQVKLDHVLRYYGQTTIIQADIGKTWLAPALTRLTVTVTDDDLAWAESSTAITVYCYDQYGVLYTGAKVVNASITTGNGTIAPASRSGSASSFSFTYTRGGADPGDVSPLLTFSSPTGAFTTAYIKLRDAGGALMV